jgi:glycosyltransferase involved in cell wall biosynthesis
MSETSRRLETTRASPDKRNPAVRICMLVHKHYYMDARVRRYAEALADHGVLVDVLCPRAAQLSLTGRRDAVRVFPIPCTHREGSVRRHLFEYLGALILYTHRLLVLHLKNRYQIIHVHNMPDFLVFAALLPRLLGAKLILDIHDPMPEFYISKYQVRSNGLAVRVMRWQEKLSALLVHSVITANSHFRANVVHRGIPAAKVSVVRNLPDPRIFNRMANRPRGRPTTDPFTLIYPGTIAPRYGLEVAIQALPFLIEHIPTVRLIIIGSGEKHLAELQNLAEALGVSPWVQFSGSISGEEVARQLDQADVGIYPALPDAHMSIAMPTKVYEYAVMGLPVIASRLRVLEEVFSDAAVLFFEPGDVVQFATRVRELFESSVKRDELVRNADCILARGHSWYDDRDLYLRLVNNLLTGGGRRVV